MEEKIKYCYQCGTKINLDENFCYKCGADLRADKSNVKRVNVEERLNDNWLDMIRRTYNMKKLSLLVFICLSILLNCIFTPWVRIFPDNNKVSRAYRNQTQIEYSTFFYKPIKFSDGLSQQEPGSKDSRGVYLGYDYKRIVIHELILAGSFLVVYLLVTVKKKKE
jgi:hypothetical protein